MNNKDREALDKFIDGDSLSPEDTKRFAEMSDGERATFIAERFFEAGAKHGRADMKAHLDDNYKTLVAKVEYLNQVNDGLHLLLKEAEAKEKKLIAVLKMVENNSLMPHKHEDYYTRLCCLSERASEILKEIGEE